jgi:hypothetical protein
VSALAATVLSLLLQGAPALAAGGDVVFVDGYEFDVCANGCPPPGWQWRQIGPAAAITQCTAVAIYGIVAGDPLLVTTCAPTPAQAGAGDTVITAVTDLNGANLGANDDCANQIVPQLANWTCSNTSGQPRMSCVPQSAAGVAATANGRITLTVCPFMPGAATTFPVFIWWNGASNPNPG